MTEELELKYAVEDGAAMQAWLDRELGADTPAKADAVAGWRDVVVRDLYFDTPTGTLAAAGYGARLRRSGSRVVVGLKSDVSADGALHRRLEIEAPGTRSLRPARWPPSEVRDTVQRLAGSEPLVERFTLHQRRRERDHCPAPGHRWLISLDAVSVVRGGSEIGTLSQLEVELRAGGAEPLLELGRRLEHSRLAVPEGRSKMALAQMMLATADRLAPDDVLADAGRKVLRRHLQRMLDRQAETRAGDTLALKQMRVATRRMRATWRVFSGAYRRRDERRYVGELRTVAAALGRVRDLDVLLESLPPDVAVEPLAAAWHARRQVAWEALLSLFESPVYRHFVKDYLEFVSAPAESAAGPAARVHVADAAGSRIWAAYERVTAHRAAIAEQAADVEALHALRIDGKRLRYTLETFRDVLLEKTASVLIERMVALQDLLGALNDADIARREAEKWLAEEAPAASPIAADAARAYVAARQAEAERLRTTLPAAWQAVAGPAFQRQLGRAVGVLGRPARRKPPPSSER